jgi:hypothetical protein
MSETLARVWLLVARGEVEVSRHGYRELAADAILFDEIIDGLGAAIQVEDYPSDARGPSVLVLQRDHEDRPIHVVWGIPKDRSGPAVLVTAYRPDPAQWSEDFSERRRS